METARIDSAKVGRLVKSRVSSRTIRMQRVVATAASVLIFTFNARGDVSSFTGSLLDYQPPAADWSKILESRIKAGEPLPDLPALEAGPPDSAESAQHLRYWRESWNRRNGQSPGLAIREKILQAVQSEPSAIPEVLQSLPQNEQAAGSVDRLLPALPDASPGDSEKRREVRAWIYLNSGLHRDEVLADARRANWELYIWNERPDPTLQAIQAREPEVATRLLKEFASGSDAGLSVVAARLLMEQSAPEAKELWRRQLIVAAANDKLPEEARHIAVDALIESKWDGRESWILSNLKLENSGEVNWYSSPIVKEPDHWIPLLVKMLNGENRHAHDHAVDLLAGFNLGIERSPRVDTLRPLLPWLKDPKWSDAGDNRGLLIRCVSEVDLPESVEGLLHVVREKGESSSYVACAAESLAHYKAKEAVPYLKEALGTCDDSYYWERIVRAIHELDGFSNAEIISSLEAYFTAYPKEEERSQSLPSSDSAMPPMLKIGSFFAKLPDKDNALLDAINGRLGDLDKERPGIAAAFRNLLIEASPSAAGDLLAKNLADGTMTEKQLVAGLNCRNHPAWKGLGFGDLSNRVGTVRGFAAVLSGARDEIAAVMKGEDEAAMAAVLAAARITGDSLDFERVSSLLDSENSDIENAAAAYLKSRKEPEAQRLWKEHHQEKDSEWDPERHVYGKYTSLEMRIREQFGISESPQEIIALKRSIPGSAETSDRWCFFLYPGSTYAVRDFGQGRVGICPLPDSLRDRVRRYITLYRVDDLPPLELMIMDGVHFRYEHVTAAGTRSVFMNNPPTSRKDVEEYLEREPTHKGIVIYAQLVKLFEGVFDELNLKPSFGREIEIVVPREKAQIKTVWKRGKDLRVLVENSPESRHWQSVNPQDGTLTGAVAEPGESAIVEDHADLHPKFDVFSEYHFRNPWRVRKGDATLHSGKFNDVEGLWWCRRGKEPELVAKGVFVEELVSPDGKWCVAAKALGSGWAEPNTAVRINLETKEVFPINLEPADNFDSVAFVPQHGRFLIMRRSDGSFPAGGDAPTGPENSEYHLLDPATGALERVTGEFGRISGNDFRPLQETNAPGIGWAADPGGGGTSASTVVGRYDSKTFSFLPMKEIKGIYFDSADMWVDEQEGMIYAAVEGDLLKIPIVIK